MNLISDFISASERRMKMKLYSATTNRTNPKFNGYFTSVYTNENSYY
ncbi:hypothetical protein NEISICOT_02982 [Neisseria sicca ATCC 29256]|uniref:Uncharacterized protein n=1 Tax=Neisseria sicca ATCC 29256 TaxID=547045 RepID=C6M8V7_NEISI|nr:hypothetical protein NEISICOT_02982 [Neisseria sicca ATCC 29256]